MAPTDPPLVNLRKAIRDAMALHRRLSWIGDEDETIVRLVAFKDSLIARYEQMGGAWEHTKRDQA